MTDSTSTSAADLPPATSADPEQSTSSATPRIRRKAPQLLADELIAEELISGAPSRNGGRKLTEDRDPWTHNAW